MLDKSRLALDKPTRRQNIETEVDVVQDEISRIHAYVSKCAHANPIERELVDGHEPAAAGYSAPYHG